MIELYNLDQPYDYILKCDRKSKSPTIWKLKHLTLEEEKYLKRLAHSTIKGKKQDEKLDKYYETALHIGLIDVENAGGDVKLERKTSGNKVMSVLPWRDDSLAAINMRFRDELAVKILNLMEIKEEDSKNS